MIRQAGGPLFTPVYLPNTARIMLIMEMLGMAPRNIPSTPQILCSPWFYGMLRAFFSREMLQRRPAM